jgi:hypothetical protein
VQSVEQLAMGWMAHGLNPGGVRFSTSIQTGPGAHPASYKTGTRSYPQVKRPGHSVDHHSQRLRVASGVTTPGPTLQA